MLSDEASPLRSEQIYWAKPDTPVDWQVNYLPEQYSRADHFRDAKRKSVANIYRGCTPQR